MLVCCFWQYRDSLCLKLVDQQQCVGWEWSHQSERELLLVGKHTKPARKTWLLAPVRAGVLLPSADQLLGKKGSPGHVRALWLLAERNQQLERNGAVGNIRSWLIWRNWRIERAPQNPWEFMDQARVKYIHTYGRYLQILNFPWDF